MLPRDPFMSERLFCPGPTPVPLSAHLAAMASSVYHRSEEFYKVFRECREALSPVFGCDAAPLILTSSGTGAMEAAVLNFTDEGDEVVVINAGKFGERWEKLTTRYLCQPRILTAPWGEPLDLAALEALIKTAKRAKALFFQANETSTGVRFYVESVAKVVRQHLPDCLIVVDAISSLVAHPMRMKEWDIDVVVAGSQKGFGVPPGLAFVAVSPRAWTRLSKRPRFYFDLKKEREEQEKSSGAWTTATTLVQALHFALARIHASGVDAAAAEHALRARAVQNAARALGLGLFAKGDHSHALTSIEVPSSVDGKGLLKTMRQKHGFIFAGGQDQLAGKIVRFSHLGFIDRFDVISGVAAIEFALFEAKQIKEMGRGVAAAMMVFASES